LIQIVDQVQMRTLHIIGSLSPVIGGPAKAVFDMARAETKQGNQVTIFTTDHGRIARAPREGHVEVRHGVTIYYFPLGFPEFFATSFAMAVALRRQLRSFDLVIIHSLYLFHDLVAGYLCRRYRILYIVRPHGSLDPYIYRAHRWRKLAAELIFNNRLLRGAAGMLYTSEDEMRLSLPYAFGAASAIVPLGVEPDDYRSLPSPGSFRRSYRETKGRRIILFLARLHPKKGLGILIEAFARAAEVHDDVHLVIAGPDGGMTEQARTWLSERNLQDRATFTGMLTGDDKLGALQDAYVFVLPSYSENFGIAVVEAMYFGIPVLISDQVNLWREVVNARAGLVSPCDPNAFADILLKILADRELSKEMGQFGRRLVLEEYTWDRIGEQLVIAYKEIILKSSKRFG
jgi:glycosyltransferase involved in cell wall biosynthesis